jgi:methyltransferase (TIGR00027 family)
MTPAPLISNVSDTARWVAIYRAQESARPDALFHDPLADRLAGERGRAIAATAPWQMRSGWSMVARTVLIDALIRQCLAEGCDRIINLAAGLDTRPYRLALPPELTWIEADLPGIIAEKNELLASEKPVCRLSRESVDLSNADARGKFLARATEGASRVLVISEGLLAYLTDDQVRALASSLATQPAIQFWIIDLASPAVRAMMKKGMGRQLVNAPMHFGPPNGVAFFEQLGWRVREIRQMMKEAVRIHRAPWFIRLATLMPEPDPRKFGRARWGGVVRLERPSV